MNFYDNESEYKSRGIDYDLGACLKYNPQDTFDLDDIEKVLAVWEGERDGDDWRWVLSLKDGRFVFLQGGCDYTGWDCQSWATHDFAETPEKAAEKALGGATIKSSSPLDAGLGHMLNVLSGKFMSNAEIVYDRLLRQVLEGKDKTWKEQKDDEFGNPPTAYLY